MSNRINTTEKSNDTEEKIQKKMNAEKIYKETRNRKTIEKESI